MDEFKYPLLLEVILFDNPMFCSRIFVVLIGHYNSHFDGRLNFDATHCHGGRSASGHSPAACVVEMREVRAKGCGPTRV